MNTALLPLLKHLLQREGRRSRFTAPDPRLGWLWKQSQWVKQWKKRWFALWPSN